MNTIVLTRFDSTIPWGFRLQGGSEDQLPFILTHIQSNSPADGKIESGDILIEIAGINITKMTHRDTLELIQRCGNALHMTVFKVGQLNRSMSYDYDQAEIPPAPAYDPNLIANISISSKNSTDEISDMPAVLAKSANRPGAPKPFTYTPGGLDLSKLIDAARNRRQQRLNRSFSLDTENMNRRMIVPSEEMKQHNYAGVTPIVPFSYARQHPIQPKKQTQNDTDAITQSRSFQLLEEWINDSEKTIATLVPQTTASSLPSTDQVQNTTPRRLSSTGQTSLPSRSFRYLQEQYSVDTPLPPTDESNHSSDYPGLRRSSDAHTPSRSFKFLQEQYHTSSPVSSNRTQTINNRDDLAEIYNKTPPSIREREPDAPRYSGSTVPSRSFRFLQMMTQDDQQNDPTPVQGYTKPQQLSLLNKYDERNLASNTNHFNEHPSRSFKYLQEMTGEHKQSTNTDSTDF